MSIMSNLNVLLVEDNPNDVLLVEQALLHKQDYLAMEVATTLTQGMKLLENHRYDVVLLDLLLPDSNPITILAPLIHVMSNHPGEYPSVVVLTGVDNSDVRLEALRMGAQGYFYKNNLEPDSDSLWVCLNDASVRGSYVRSLLHKGFPFSPMPAKMVTDVERLIDNLVGGSRKDG
jgi:DNA-binding NarL/FixJ family response regulator